MTETEAAAEAACRLTFLRFFQCLDAGDAAGASALIARDGVWHRQGKRLVGPEGVLEVVGGRPANRTVRHHFCNLIVTLETPEAAWSKAYYTVYAHEGDERPRVINGAERVGDYHAGYVLDETGWRLSLLRAERLFTIAPRELTLSGGAAAESRTPVPTLPAE